MSAAPAAVPSRAQQGCLRVATVSGAFTCTTLILLIAAWATSLTPRQHPTLITTTTASAVPTARSLPSKSNTWCAYGTLPATWVSTPPSAPGSRWTTFDPQCPLQPLLPRYADGPATTSLPSKATTPTEQAAELDVTVLDPETDPNPTTTALVQQPHAHKASAILQPAKEDGEEGPPTASILFISDSVDRHVLTYLCEHVGGTVRATVLKDALPLMPGGRNLSASALAGRRSAAAVAPGSSAEAGAARIPSAGTAAAAAGGSDAAAGGDASEAAATAGNLGVVATGPVGISRAAARRRGTAPGRTRSRRAAEGRKAVRSALDALAESLTGATGISNTAGRTTGGTEPSVHTSRHLTQSLSSSSTTSASSAASAPPSTPAGEPPSGYVVNTCSTPGGRLRLAASYIPGVHPTGPFHKGRTLAYPRRIEHVKAVWKAYAPGSPDIVVVASLLWDLARASAYEPSVVAQQELPRSYLDSWAANYTRVVQYAQAALPEAKLWVYHTNASPRHHPVTGVMDKSYLGQANHVRQLNAMGRHVATQLGMEVIDYERIASRFQEGQAYLVDQIHPGREVGLEIANIYLNYVQQLRRQRQGPRSQAGSA